MASDRLVLGHGTMLGVMDEVALREMLTEFSQGSLNADDVVRLLRRLPYSDLGFAKVDHHRALRQGLPEAVYAPGKSPEHCAQIVADLLSEPGGPVVLSRADEEQSVAALELCPGGERGGGGVIWRHAPRRHEKVVVVTAGTADLPVAEECLCVLRAFGWEPTLLADCGVAGVHRFLAHAETVIEADAVVVVAGMEGALASLVGGVTAAPVVAVPTSVGYGSSLEGITALLAMMSSCASGICVVGIDNGFGAAWTVARILL